MDRKLGGVTEVVDIWDIDGLLEVSGVSSSVSLPVSRLG